MELGYLLLALDVVLFVGLVVVYRARRGDGPLLARLQAERAALEEARAQAVRAVEDAIAARMDLERAQKRAERMARDWAVSASRGVDEGMGPAEAKMARALQGLRRAS